MPQGHEYIVTDDKEGENSELEKHLEDCNILISTPFHPAYLTKERIEKAKNLKLSITAGVGSDHVDLHAAADSGMTVAEVTGNALKLKCGTDQHASSIQTCTAFFDLGARLCYFATLAILHLSNPVICNCCISSAWHIAHSTLALQAVTL